VKLQGDSYRTHRGESVILCIPVQAAAIDSFITQVKSMDLGQIGAKVRLPMAGSVGEIT
jgi:hypothetical protein